MTVLLISRSLRTISSSDKLETSSQLYELSLARALSEYDKVILLGASDANLETDRALSLVSTRDGIVSTIREQERKVRGPLTIVLFGYDPRRLLSVFWARRSRSIRVVPFVFDHHSVASATRGKLRRSLINCYFALGIKLLRHADGLAYLNPAAPSFFKMPDRVPRIQTRIGTGGGAQSCDNRPRGQSRPLRILFAGSNYPINGLQHVLSALALDSALDVRLDICGSGPQDADTFRQQALDPRIVHHGRAPHKFVEEKLAEADLVVCLRDPDHVVAKAAFPSKLIEALAASVPVLANPFPTSLPLEQLTHVAHDFAPGPILDLLRELVENSVLLNSKTQRAKQFVESQHSWSAVSEELHEFFGELPLRRYRKVHVR